MPEAFVSQIGKNGGITDNHEKSQFRSAFRDAALFGRVISAGLVVAGYAFAGVYLARWMEGKGCPAWGVSLAPLAAALFGAWQGWLFLTRPFGRDRPDGEKRAPRR